VQIPRSCQGYQDVMRRYCLQLSYRKVLEGCLRNKYEVVEVHFYSSMQSKAAAMQQPEMITICRKEYEDLKDTKCVNIIHQTIRQSKAASLSSSGVNAAQLIHNFIFSKH
jgi:hypothetical protein